MALSRAMIELASQEEKKEFVFDLFASNHNTELGVDAFNNPEEFIKECYGFEIHDAEFWIQIKEDFFGSK